MVDELSVVLLSSAVALTAALVWKWNSSQPDVLPSKINSQCEVSRTRHQGETAVYRSRSAYGGLVSTVWEDSKTLYEAFQRGLRNHANRQCLGQRINDGDFVWQTYREVADTIDALASGFQALGIPPGQKTFVGIYSINRPEWIITEQACNAYSMVSVAVYDTLGQDAVKHIIVQCDMPAIVASLDKIEGLISVASGCPLLKLIISMDNNVPEDLIAKARSAGVKLMSFKSVCDEGKAKGIQPHLPPSPNDIATICYTSGTTGLPKGAILTHGNLIANNAAIVKSWPQNIMPTHEDVYLSYLPLAHMLERLIHTFIYANGARVGFYRGDVKKLLDDVGLLRPTYFVSVPRMWNRIYDRVQATVESSSFVKKNMFKLAYQAKLRMLRQGIIRNDTIWDWLVFGKIRARLGGRCKALVTGAAPIAPEVLDMLRICFGCQVYEGYGQTEACAAVLVTITGDYSTGHVGSPLPCVEVKLVDVPEMNYTAEDKPNPRGELCVRGTSVFKGYYKDEEKTREAVDSEGWLHTGDIAEVRPNGTFRIIDRKKNIFKLSQGEYIAAEKIENVLIKSTFIEQAWVYGDSLRASLVAVVVLDAEIVQPWAKSQGLPTDLQSLATSAQAKELIVKDIINVCKQSKLHSFEIPREFIIEVNPFSVENGLLTPTFKIKRAETKAKYEKQILAAYNTIEGKGSSSK